jgi:hypothetical protein
MQPDRGCGNKHEARSCSGDLPVTLCWGSLAEPPLRSRAGPPCHSRARAMRSPHPRNRVNYSPLTLRAEVNPVVTGGCSPYSTAEPQAWSWVTPNQTDTGNGKTLNPTPLSTFPSPMSDPNPTFRFPFLPCRILLSDPFICQAASFTPAINYEQ